MYPISMLYGVETRNINVHHPVYTNAPKTVKTPKKIPPSISGIRKNAASGVAAFGFGLEVALVELAELESGAVALGPDSLVERLGAAVNDDALPLDVPLVGDAVEAEIPVVGVTGPVYPVMNAISHWRSLKPVRNEVA